MPGRILQWYNLPPEEDMITRSLQISRERCSTMPSNLMKFSLVTPFALISITTFSSVQPTLSSADFVITLNGYVISCEFHQQNRFPEGVNPHSQNLPSRLLEPLLFPLFLPATLPSNAMITTVQVRALLLQ
jgi:hypothetical protein